jgi:hypothetical protein
MQLFRLFRRPSRPAPVRRVRLTLECLDGRICPDTDPTNPSNPDYVVSPVDNPPQIVDFVAWDGGGGHVTISGKVIDENPAGLTVYFSGPQAAINGQTVTTNSDGTFSLSVTLSTNGSDDGVVSAWTFDRAGHKSNVVYADVHPR